MAASLYPNRICRCGPGRLQTRPYTNKIPTTPVIPVIEPSFRRKPESRKSPGKERAGYRGFWIPAFAGTTVAWNDGYLGCYSYNPIAPTNCS